MSDHFPSVLSRRTPVNTWVTHPILPCLTCCLFCSLYGRAPCRSGTHPPLPCLTCRLFCRLCGSALRRSGQRGRSVKTADSSWSSSTPLRATSRAPKPTGTTFSRHSQPPARRPSSKPEVRSTRRLRVSWSASSCWPWRVFIENFKMIFLMGLSIRLQRLSHKFTLPEVAHDCES